MVLNQSFQHNIFSQFHVTINALFCTTLTWVHGHTFNFATFFCRHTCFQFFSSINNELIVTVSFFSDCFSIVCNERGVIPFHVLLIKLCAYFSKKVVKFSISWSASGKWIWSSSKAVSICLIICLWKEIIIWRNNGGSKSYTALV
jgi:hypothetical protein